METFIEDHEVEGVVEKWVVVTPGFESEDENVSSEDESESDDELPLADLIPLAGLASNYVSPEEPEVEKERTYRWRKGRPPAANNFAFKGDDHLGGYEDLKEPIDFFRMFFDVEMIRSISKQTNLYSTQCYINKGSIGTSPDEIENYLGVLLRMCIVQMPRYRMYWETETRYEQVAGIMSRNRFELIKKFLHFADNNNAPDPRDPNRDKLYKIRELFEQLRQNCLKVKPEEKNSIDEQIVPFKGKSSLRRYLPKKPKKWGFKIFSRNSVRGFCHDFELDGAPDPTRPPCESIGLSSGDIVLRMCASLPKHQNYKVFFDNYFTHLVLLSRLKEWGMFAVGTLRQNRIKGCTLKTENELKKEGRGSFDGAVDLNSGLTVVRWYDNKMVQLGSNYAFTEPVETVRRWSTKEKQYVDVERPAIVQIYNGGMGGVDLFDMFQALYRLHHRSKKGYMRIFFWILGTSLINAWCLYRRLSGQGGIPQAEQTDLLHFTAQVASSLVRNYLPKRGRGRPSLEPTEDDTAKRPRRPPTRIPQDDVRHDGLQHWPEHRPDRPRCSKCGDKTRIGCTKCRVGLCITASRNCYKDFHTN